MTSLFTSFDMFMFYKSTILIFIVSIIVLTKLFILNSNSKLISLIFDKNLSKFFFSLKSKSFNKFSILLLFSFFLVLMLNNSFSVFSFNFPLTSQFGLIFFGSLLVWSSFMIFNLTSNFKGGLSHFTPEGAPVFLVLFLFLIEIISNFIRPLTLSVRLVANILAGHLLMILLSKIVLVFKMSFFLYLLLNTVEIFVALIQAYIFTTMVALYFAEVH